jgi:DNA-binding CsgD family transcriptional regulator
MSIQPKTREEDERLLRLLEGRALGISTQQLAKTFGLSRSGISAMTNRVYRAMEQDDG